MGPQTDEFFTLAIGGMVTMLNNSQDHVFPGDMLEWCFYNEKNTGRNGGVDRANKRLKGNPRRISIKVATPTSERVIGRCLSFAKAGETFGEMHYLKQHPHTYSSTGSTLSPLTDLLLKSC